MPYSEPFLREAIRLSKEKMEAGEGGPFGAVVVREGKIVGRGWNRVTSAHDPTAHAEVEAIRNACQYLGTFSLAGCEIYTSCEPCPMCLAAIYWARIDALYYAATRDDAADAGFDDMLIYNEILKPIMERKLHAEQHLQADAQRVMAIWISQSDKLQY
jgi:guanine deaminase